MKMNYSTAECKREIRDHQKTLRQFRMSDRIDYDWYEFYKVNLYRWERRLEAAHELAVENWCNFTSEWTWEQAVWGLRCWPYNPYMTEALLINIGLELGNNYTPSIEDALIVLKIVVSLGTMKFPCADNVRDILYDYVDSLEEQRLAECCPECNQEWHKHTVSGVRSHAFGFDPPETICPIDLSDNCLF